MQTDEQFRSEILSPRENVVVLALEGAVDIHAAPEFKALLLASVERGKRQVIVDLTKVTFLDSSGLGVLVSGSKQAQKGSLAIVCDDEPMMNVFAMVGVDRIFAVFASRAAALAAAD